VGVGMMSRVPQVEILQDGHASILTAWLLKHPDYCH